MNKTINKYKISEIIKEIVDPNLIDLSSIQLHDVLNPDIWDKNDKIKPDVRKILLKNAKRFIEFCDIEDLKFDDIILTGSLANYNYNENSDLDVHIVLNYSQISNNKDFVGDFFRLKKELWSSKYTIKVKGFDVELYIQDSNELHYSTGVYSLIKNKWVRKPTKKIISINTNIIKQKAFDIMNSIDDLETNLNRNDFMIKYNMLKNKIKKYRQSGLEKNGEYSVENLVFKILRNTGYLKKLTDLKKRFLEKELSLNEINF